MQHLCGVTLVCGDDKFLYRREEVLPHKGGPTQARHDLQVRNRLSTTNKLNFLLLPVYFEVSGLFLLKVLSLKLFLFSKVVT